MAEPAPRTLLDAIDAGRGEHRLGYTFTGPGDSERFFSFDRLRQEAIRRAHNLRQRGLKPGDRLALVLPDGADFVPTFFGALWAGIIPVPLYPPLAMAKLDGYRDGLVATLTKAAPSRLCTSAGLAPILGPMLDAGVPGLGPLLLADEIAAEAPGASEAPVAVGAEDAAFLQFTSGSTAQPKGVIVTHGSLAANCAAIREGLALNSAHDVGVTWLPLYHDMGLIGFVCAPIFVQVPVVFMPTTSFVKSASLWLETLHRKRGTVTFAPNFAYALVAKRVKPETVARWDLSCVKAFGCGAEPIQPATLRAFAETLAPAKLNPNALLPCYGMAEATLAISFAPLNDPLKTDVIDAARYALQRRAHTIDDRKSVIATHEFVSCGKAFAGHRIAVLDDTGKELPERAVGEIVLSGPSVTSGYFRDPEASATALRDGWLHTGDLGYIADSELYITGRKKDLVIINGKNYDPQRIEGVVDEIPQVRRGSSVAFTRPGAATEELVVVAESRFRNAEELKAAIRRTLSEQLQLNAEDVVLVEPGSLPKTSSGKLQRQKTRDQYLASELTS